MLLQTLFPPPSPLPLDIQPGQNNPYFSPESAKSLHRDITSCNENPLPNQTGGCVVAQTTTEGHNYPPQPGTSNTHRSVSPTKTWTNLPASQPPQLEMPDSHMMVDSTANSIEGDCEDSIMLPSNPDPPSTPKGKAVPSSPPVTSGQKEPLPAKKPSQGKQLDDSPTKARPSAGASLSLRKETLSSASDPGLVTPIKETVAVSPDPVSPISSFGDNVPNKPAPELEDPKCNDPITATPPSQRSRPCNKDPSCKVAIQYKHAVQEGQGTEGVSDPVNDPSTQVSKRIISKPTRKSEALDKKTDPPIHAALKKSSTLSANDGTQICIDITGDQDAIEQEGLINTSSGTPDEETRIPAHLATLAPFLEASGKWFPNFDPNLRQHLAEKAQQLAIHGTHFPSFHTAFYLLSKGPWVPAHISVHVRQAALAAVGVGWSWVNQVPTVFPFNCFDASVSLATLDNLPPGEMKQSDAVFAFYATVCGNLNQSTRAFLFTKYDLQCNACGTWLNLSVDHFNAAVSSTTTFEEVLHRMTPTWNLTETTDRQKCSCLNLEQALSRCLKLGPVTLIRLKAEQGETLPRIEAGHFPLSHQFTFQNRMYEIRCLVTVNRTDQDSPLLVIQAGQTGNISVYDHNNGLRVLDSSRINSKLFIIGVLVLPIKSPRAILTTKDLVTIAGAVDQASYTKKQLRVVKGILKPPRKNKERTSGPISQGTQRLSKKRKSQSRAAKTKAGKPKSCQNEGELSLLTAIDPEGLPLTIVDEAGPAKVGIISMFDGVGSIYHIIKKKLGKPPVVYIAAEQDPVLRRLVAAELGMREDQHWGYNSEGVCTIYVKDVWDLLLKDLLILRQAKVMYPNIKWLLISGSPCQDLTFAGYLNGLLGLTGKRSMLFFVVYVVLCHAQKLFGFGAVRYLAENAGSMQAVQGDRKMKAGHPLERSEHFQLFLYCLGLPRQMPIKHWVWDTSSFFGIRRQRVFLRSHLDTGIPIPNSPPGQ